MNINTDIQECIEHAIRLLEANGYTVKRPVREVHDEYTFDKAWDLYQKKVGDKQKLRDKWNRLPLRDRKAIIEYIPLYIAATPDKKFRKNFQTFLNQKGWKDEIVKDAIPEIVRKNLEESSTSRLLEKVQEQRKQWSADAKDQALRQRILGMIQVLHNNPKSLCRGQLQAYYDNGTIARLGIQWKPENS